MTAPMTAPILPPLYEPAHVDEVADVRAEAVRRARAGAGEGTLVWSTAQQAGRGRRGHAWESPPDNLYCGLVIQPDYPLATALELGHVAVVSAGAAIADVVPAMVDLRYRWPNDVLLQRAKVAGVHLEADASGDPPAWLVVGLYVNVTACPDLPGHAAASIAGDAATPAAPSLLLEGWTRQFLSWINRWAEEGFAPVHRVWLQRAEGVGEPAAIDLGGETVEGKLLEVDEHGAALLETAAGARRIDLATFYGVGPGSSRR